jgi:hypothetical protein
MSYDGAFLGGALMPIHDWTRVTPGTFHHFHQAWTIAIANALNGGGLPPDFFALADQIVSGPIPDVVTLKRKTPRTRRRPAATPVAVADAPPKAWFITRAEAEDTYANRANRILIQHELSEVVAVIEIVSPGNKNSQHALRSFVTITRELLENGIHLLIVDLFPPTPRDPQGIHPAIWGEIRDEPFELPADKPLTVAAYAAGPVKTAYVEPVAGGDPLPEMPIFLTPDAYVPAPLESTYQATWEVCPEPIRELFEEV